MTKSPAVFKSTVAAAKFIATNITDSKLATHSGQSKPPQDLRCPHYRSRQWKCQVGRFFRKDLPGNFRDI